MKIVEKISYRLMGIEPHFISCPVLSPSNRGLIPGGRRDSSMGLEVLTAVPVEVTVFCCVRAFVVSYGGTNVSEGGIYLPNYMATNPKKHPSDIVLI
jgi:hypothetical protein